MFTAETIIQDFHSNVGDCLSSLGDDTTVIQVVYTGEDFNFTIITNLYKSVANWDVELKKSLVGRTTTEFLREQTHGGYVVSYKMFNKNFDQQIKHITDSAKPVSHVMKTFFAAESLSRISKLLDAIAGISKLSNINLIPKISTLVDCFLEYNIDKFKLFTEACDYVPIWNTKAWAAAGKPETPNKYSVHIKDIKAAMTLAGKESEWYASNVLKGSVSGKDVMTDAIGLSWTKSNMSDYDHISSLEASRLFRYLVARNKGDRALCDKIEKEVQEIPGISDFYDEINGIKEVVDDDDGEIIDPVVLTISASSSL